MLTAHDLFYRDGIRATGVDKVIAESGVSKVTFYRHFPSKRDLIRAFLEYRHQRWMSWFEDALKRYGAQPGEGLKPLLPALNEWFTNPIYRGCAFINTAAELGDTLPDALAICRNHKQDMVNIIMTMLPLSPDQERLANAVAIAVDGAIVKAQLEQGSDQPSQALDGLVLVLEGLERLV